MEVRSGGERSQIEHVVGEEGQRGGGTGKRLVEQRGPVAGDVKHHAGHPGADDQRIVEAEEQLLLRSELGDVDRHVDAAGGRLAAAPSRRVLPAKLTNGEHRSPRGVSRVSVGAEPSIAAMVESRATRCPTPPPAHRNRTGSRRPDRSWRKLRPRWCRRPGLGHGRLTGKSDLTGNRPTQRHWRRNGRSSRLPSRRAWRCRLGHLFPRRLKRSRRSTSNRPNDRWRWRPRLRPGKSDRGPRHYHPVPWRCR